MLATKQDELKRHLLVMRRGSSLGRAKPHKLLMLLAVLDLFDARRLQENRIHFDPSLIELFEDYFRAVAKDDDWFQPGPPFFHLRSSPFWHLQAKEGREQEYAALKTSGGGSRRIVDNVAYAYLSDDVYSLLLEKTSRDEIRLFILDAFFDPQERDLLMGVVRAHHAISETERSLEDGQLRESSEGEYAVRSVAFRRVVLRAYEYRCAACGLKIVLPDLPSPVEAAHLIPWSESHDDTPQNGIALCKLHHWALDVSLIAPSFGFRWKVSALLDARRDSERELTRLAGRQLLLPQPSLYHPKRDALEWRLSRLAR